MNVLDQDRVWVNAHHEKVPISEIDARYARNIVNLLERNIVSVQIQYFTGFAMPNSDTIAYDDVEQVFDAEIEQDPIEWLHERKLVRALCAKFEDGCRQGVK